MMVWECWGSWGLGIMSVWLFIRLGLRGSGCCGFLWFQECGSGESRFDEVRGSHSGRPLGDSLTGAR